MATKLLLATALVSLFFTAAIGQRLSEAQQCRLQRLQASRPSQRLESEGGTTELWNENEEQFQCAGVAPMKNTLRPNSLSLPNFHPYPRLVYIEQGEGLMGLTFPGCAETYQSESQEEEQQQQRTDLHQRVHHLRKGDIIALPAGVVHWTLNNGNEPLIAVSVNDLSHQHNQLDQKFRSFYLAGGMPSQSTEHRQYFHNIFRAFDTNLLAEAFDAPEELIRKIQREDNRGIIINVPKGVSHPKTLPQEVWDRFYSSGAKGSNGFEETLCTMKMHTSLENRREADVYSKDAGRLNSVNRLKLPILGFLDMSAERGSLNPNALFSPHWATNGHRIVYILRGDAQVEVVSNNGQGVMNDRVNQGDMFVIPQFYASTARAGSSGMEWMSIKTTSAMTRSPLAGYTSAFRAMPLQVITNSYRVSPQKAQELKLNRGGETFLLSPGRSSS